MNKSLKRIFLNYLRVDERNVVQTFISVAMIFFSYFFQEKSKLVQDQIKSNESSEDSNISFGDFFCFFFQERVLKCSNNYRCAFMNVNAFMNELSYMCTF